MLNTLGALWHFLYVRGAFVVYYTDASKIIPQGSKDFLLVKVDVDTARKLYDPYHVCKHIEKKNGIVYAVLKDGALAHIRQTGTGKAMTKMLFKIVPSEFRKKIPFYSSWSVWTEPSFRRMGLSEITFSVIARDFTEVGITTMVNVVDVNNTAQQAFLAKFGAVYLGMAFSTRILWFTYVSNSLALKEAFAKLGKIKVRPPFDWSVLLIEY